MAEDKKKELPKAWTGSDKAIRAVQVAFDLEEKLHHAIRRAACIKGISPSDQIRLIVDLPTSRPARRPRLTASFTETDYSTLADRYQLDKNDRLEIKKKVMEELIAFAQKLEKE